MGGFIVIPKAADQSAEEVEARYGKSLDVVELHRNLTRDLHGTLTHPMSRVWLN